MSKPPVLVIPTAKVDRWILGPGFVSANRLPSVDFLLGVDGYHFMERQLAEVDEDFQQVIPYLFVRSPSGWFHYRRSEAGTEKRLHSLWSCGVGGHVEPVDGSACNPYEAYRAGMCREMIEELGESRFEDTFIGLVRDPSNAVGRVHLGFVHVASVESDVLSTDVSLMAAGHASAEELVRLLPKMESWSRLVLESPESGLLPALLRL